LEGYAGYGLVRLEKLGSRVNASVAPLVGGICVRAVAVYGIWRIPLPLFS